VLTRSFSGAGETSERAARRSLNDPDRTHTDRGLFFCSQPAKQGTLEVKFRLVHPDTWPATTLNRAPDNDRYAPRCDFIETVEEPPQHGHADIAYHHRRHAMESDSVVAADGTNRRCRQHCRKASVEDPVKAFRPT
jgi:hypothetical protein